MNYPVLLRDKGTGCLNEDKYPWCHICKVKRAKMGRHDKFGNRICINCYLKFVYSNYKQKTKKANDKKNPNNGPKRITFQGKRVFIGRTLRSGKCSECGKGAGDPYIDVHGKHAIIKQTQMHHWFYLIIMPWACAVELCTSCHGYKQKIRES